MIIKNGKKRMAMLIISIIAILLSFFSTNLKSHSVNAADDLDLASKILCKFEYGDDAVRFHSTDYFHYLTRSKSAITKTQEVDRSWLNRFLGLAGYDFVGVNEEILGRDIRPKELPKKTITEANTDAPKVSAFDRFGVSGLTWSSYQGEWKYYHINPCVTGSEVSPTKFGTFYDGRLEPESTHDEVPTSVDPRSVQYNKSVESTMWTAFMDILSNTMFLITKGIITLTIAFVGYSFTDLTTTLGMLSKDGENGGSASDVFISLFDGLFSGFVLIIIAITAMYILYKGLIRREMRFALNTLIKTIAIFIIAIVMSTNPSYWIGIPNKVTSYGQAVLLNAMSTIYEDEAGSASLCTSEVGSIDEGVSIDISNPDRLKSEFEKTTDNIRSMIGCNMWQVFLLEPWAKGQFGADYKDLSAKNVKNENEDWVGTPSVPVGAGEAIDNWALFHLSTQTNVHAPIDEASSLPIIVNGVNSDWWRIVDALSDYEEEIVIEVDETGVEHRFSEVVDKKTTEYWESWVGNNAGERFSVAFISIAFGVVGSIAPLVFGIASAVFGLGITLLMMVSPLFFLLGLLGGKGDGIFFGWLEMLINTIIKKITTGLLLVLSLTFSMTIMNLIDDIGFIKSFILMVIVTTLLIKNKDKMLEMLASVDFGGTFDPRQKTNQFTHVAKRSVATVGGFAGATAAGAVESKLSGQGFMSGAYVGVQRQLSNKLYMSPAGMNIVRQMEITRGGDKSTNHNCITCHKLLGEKGGGKEIAYRDEYGNYYCTFCAEEMGLEQLHEVVVGTDRVTDYDGTNIQDDLIKSKDRVIKDEDIRTIHSTSGKSKITHRDFKEIMNVENVNGEYSWNKGETQESIKENILHVQQDFVVFKNVQLLFGRRVTPPSAPEPLQGYIDLALINMAWVEGRFDIIEQTYKDAWKSWYEDNAEAIGDDDESIERFKKEIDDLNFEVGPEETKELLDKYLMKDLRLNDGSRAKQSYVMLNGKITLYNHDIDKVNKDSRK